MTGGDGYDTIHQIYLGNGIIMHLMHDWWSAFILIANRARGQISGGRAEGWTHKFYGFQPSLEIFNYRNIHFLWSRLRRKSACGHVVESPQEGWGGLVTR